MQQSRLNAMNVGLRNFTKNSSKYIDSTKVLGRMLSTAMKAKYQEPNYLYLLDNLKDYLERALLHKDFITI